MSLIINLNGIDEEIDEKFLIKYFQDTYNEIHSIDYYKRYDSDNVNGIIISFNLDDRRFRSILTKSVLEKYVLPVQRETHLNRLL